MFSALRAIPTPIRRAPIQLRTAATQAQRRAGDISDAFVSLSGQKFEPLSPEYAALKGRLIKGHESEVRVLGTLVAESTGRDPNNRRTWLQDHPGD
jgi:hypothetical protein